MRVKIDPLDRLASEYIRRRAIKLDGGCQRCLAPKFDRVKEDGSIYPAWKQLETSHFIGRANKATRYDPDNMIGICAGCHMYFTAHPLEHVEFFKRRLGEEKFEFLQGRMRNIGMPDKGLIEIYLKEKLANLTEVL